MINKLSFYVLTFNSEKIIEKTLKSVKDIVDEIIVVDSGSTDSTKKICKKYTENIYDFSFKIGGFTESRKYAQSKCTYDWIMYLDSDEVLTQKLFEEIKLLKNNFDIKSYDAISFYWKPIMWFESKPHIFAKQCKVIRFYNKKKCFYQNHPFWDIPIVKEDRIYQTKNYYNHYCLSSINHYYDKMINRNIGVIDNYKRYNLCFLIIKFLFIFQLSFFIALFNKRLIIYGFIGIKMSLIYAYSRFLIVYMTLQHLIKN